MTRVRRPLLAKPAPRLTAVVVFTHPPFWLTCAITQSDYQCATLSSPAGPPTRAASIVSLARRFPDTGTRPGVRSTRPPATRNRAIIPMPPASGLAARLRGDTGHRVVRYSVACSTHERSFPLGRARWAEGKKALESAARERRGDA